MAKNTKFHPYNEVITPDDSKFEQYKVYLDGLTKGVEPKQWMMASFVQMLKMAFIELEDKNYEDVAALAQRWLNERNTPEWIRK